MPSRARNRAGMPLGRSGRTGVRRTSRSRLRRPFRARLGIQTGRGCAEAHPQPAPGRHPQPTGRPDRPARPAQGPPPAGGASVAPTPCPCARPPQSQELNIMSPKLPVREGGAAGASYRVPCSARTRSERVSMSRDATRAPAHPPGVGAHAHAAAPRPAMSMAPDNMGTRIRHQWLRGEIGTHPIFRGRLDVTIHCPAREKLGTHPSFRRSSGAWRRP